MFSATNKDQEDFDNQPREYHEHLMKAMLHHAGLGPHPGAYSPLKELAQEAGGTPDEEEIAKRGPTPPQEAIGPQPPISGGKDKGSGKPPSGTTPTAIGAAAAAPAPVESEEF